MEEECGNTVPQPCAGSSRMAWHGTARHGTARHGTARHGTARHGMDVRQDPNAVHASPMSISGLSLLNEATLEVALGSVHEPDSCQRLTELIEPKGLSVTARVPSAGVGWQEYTSLGCHSATIISHRDVRSRAQMTCGARKGSGWLW